MSPSLFLYSVRMALPSVELRSASPHFGPSHNLLRHRFRDNSYLAGPIPLPVPGVGTSALWQCHVSTTYKNIAITLKYNAIAIAYLINFS